MTPKQRRAVAAAVIIGVTTPFMSSALNLSVTSISADFSCAATTATWVLTIYTIAFASVSAVMGRRADQRGKRRMILTGTIVFALAGLVCACAPNVYVLIAARGVMGIGVASLFSTSVALMLMYFDPDVKGRMLGITSSAVYVGLSLGPVLGGALNDAIGWRGLFLIVSAACVVVIVLTAQLDDDTVAKKPASSDVLGNVLFVAAMALSMFGLTELNQLSWAWVSLVAGICILVLFVLHETRTEMPAINVRLFRTSPTYALSNLSALLNFGAVSAISYTVALFMQNVMGLPSGFAGLVMIVSPLCQMVISPLAGRLSDRFNAASVASVGLVISAAGILVLSRIKVDSTLALIVVGLALLGLGLGVFSSPNNNAIISCVDRSHYAEANSMLATMRGTGQSISMAITTFMLSLSAGKLTVAQIAPDVLTGAIANILLVCAGISVVAFVCSLACRATR